MTTTLSEFYRDSEHHIHSRANTYYSPYSTTNVQACLCGSANCRLFLGPKPAGEKKPSSKKEQLDMAMNLKRTASGASKRKVSELFDAAHGIEVEIPKELVKKRKVPQMSKGWAYIDEDMERQRIEEAEKDKALRRLQREGLLPEIEIARPKYKDLKGGRATAAAAVSAGKKAMEKVKTMASGKGKGKEPAKTSYKPDEDEPKVVKPGVMNRVSGSIRRRVMPESDFTDKRKSAISMSSSFRQSTINFQPRSVSGASGEALLERPKSSSSLSDKALKRSSVISRTSTKGKRASTVRLVGEDE